MFDNLKETTEIPIHENTELKIKKISKAIEAYYNSREFEKGNHLILPIITRKKETPEIVPGVPEPELDSVVFIYSLKTKQGPDGPNLGQWLETMVQAFDYISNIMANLLRGVEVLKREIKSSNSEWKN